MNITINGKTMSASGDLTILQAARQNGVRIPTLYYLEGIMNYDDSGVCVVEVAGKDGVFPAADTYVEEGMEILTDTESVKAARTEALKKIVALHDYDCNSCEKIDSCELKPLLKKYGLTHEKGLAKEDFVEIDNSSNTFVRNNNKCIRCGRCANVCGRVQGIGAINVDGEGLDADYKMQRGAFVDSYTIGGTVCTNCGQCVSVCPTGALIPKSHVEKVKAALADKDKYVVVQAAPAVRAALGECFAFPIGVDVEGKIAAALKELGFDKVFDTKLSADLTIMEEANELIERISNGGKLPLITSCCPGWIKFAEDNAIDFLPNISSCKSPHQMMGATVKSYFAEKMGIDREKIFMVSVMPCTAKKFEITRADQDGTGVPDVDAVLTTVELGKMIKDADIPFEALPNYEPFDDPLGRGTGAGVIFGATGGVMEAALRTAVEKLTGETIEKVEFSDVRGMEGVKEASYDINGQNVKVAVVSGLENVRELLHKVRLQMANYTFIEVMACPGGCINGGGQPHQSGEVRDAICVPAERAATLYRSDENSEVRKSHENPEIKELYGSYFGTPGSEKAHELLHTTYVAHYSND